MSVREAVFEVLWKHDPLFRALAEAPNFEATNTVEREDGRIVACVDDLRFVFDDEGARYASSVMRSLLKSGRDTIPFFVGGPADPTVGLVLERPLAEFFRLMLVAMLDETRDEP